MIAAVTSNALGLMAITLLFGGGWLPVGALGALLAITWLCAWRLWHRWRLEDRLDEYTTVDAVPPTVADRLDTYTTLEARERGWK